MQSVKHKIAVRIVKSGEMRYYSQLDMVNILERALRRSGLPVYFSQGFNPRIKISFYGGLKLGVEGAIDAAFYFTQPLTVAQLTDALNPYLPEGIKVEGA